MTSIPPESSPIEQMSELIESDSASLPQAASAQSIITVSAPDQPLHPEVPSKISNPSGVRRREKVLKTTFNRGVDGGNISDPLNSTPIIQDFSSSSSSRPGVLPPVPAPTKGLSNPTTKSKMPTGNASNITTPDNSILDIQYAPSSSSIVAGPSKKRKLQPEPQSDTKAKAKGNKKTKVRPQLVTPFEYAQKLQEKMMLPADKKPSQGVFKYLKGKKIFYIGGDMQYAGERTRGRMDYVNSCSQVICSFLISFPDRKIWWYCPSDI
jgi:hypothetical protein